MRALIKENYDLKMQNATDIERIGNLTSEVSQLRQPFKVTSQQDELRDAKCQLYEVVNRCQQMLIVKSGASAGVDDPELNERSNRQDNENNLRLNRELFSLELTNLTDLSRFLDWEVSHLQTISDLAS